MLKFFTLPRRYFCFYGHSQTVKILHVLILHVLKSLKIHITCLQVWPKEGKVEAITHSLSQALFKFKNLFVMILIGNKPRLQLNSFFRERKSPKAISHCNTTGVTIFLQSWRVLLFKQPSVTSSSTSTWWTKFYHASFVTDWLLMAFQDVPIWPFYPYFTKRLLLAEEDNFSMIRLSFSPWTDTRSPQEKM